jgi:hypothetical protein
MINYEECPFCGYSHAEVTERHTKAGTIVELNCHSCDDRVKFVEYMPQQRTSRVWK